MHIHFSIARPGARVISGMRKDCDSVIDVKFYKAVSDGSELSEV